MQLRYFRAVATNMLASTSDKTKPTAGSEDLIAARDTDAVKHLFLEAPSGVLHLFLPLGPGLEGKGRQQQ